MPYFEADRGDEFCELGFSKERRLKPQITIGRYRDVQAAADFLDQYRARMDVCAVKLAPNRLSASGDGGRLTLRPALLQALKRLFGIFE